MVLLRLFRAFLGNDVSVGNLSVVPFDLISVMAPLIKEKASFVDHRFAFEPK